MKKIKALFAHGFLLLFIALLFMPIYLAIVAASHEATAMMHAPLPMFPGHHFFSNLADIFNAGLDVTGGIPLKIMLINSLIMALLIAVGKIILAAGSAYALVYFDFPAKSFCFALIFATMMLPVEVRIVPTFQITASLGMLNSFSGLSLPLMASATATFLFRQFFKTVSPSLVDAAKIDGAGPFRFFWHILLPVSKTQIMALFVILFVYGWNQYLWPLVITTDPSQATIVMGIKYVSGVADQIPQWNYIMCMALVAFFPPCLVVLLMQYWFEKGLK